MCISDIKYVKYQGITDCFYKKILIRVKTDTHVLENFVKSTKKKNL